MVRYSCLIFAHQLKVFVSSKWGCVPLYGITQDPATREYAFVLYFIENGSIRDFHHRLHKEHNANENWLAQAREIADSVSQFHQGDSLHGDLHSGNILIHA